MYAVYKNKIYLANIRQSKVRLKTRFLEPGFSELVDLAGNIHKDIFIKEVDMNDVEIIYEIEYRVVYRGSEYKCLKVNSQTLDINYITIYTSEYDIAVEQSIYYKHGLEEIDEIILNITIAIRYSRCEKK